MQNVDVAKYLFRLYPETASKPDRFGMLPLHLVGEFHDDLEIINLIFNAHPEAMDVRDEDGDTPMDKARETEEYEEGNVVVVNFLQCQDQLRRQARARARENTTTPIHFALLSKDVSVGVLKLLLADYPKSLQKHDLEHYHAIHIACQLGNFEIINFLLEKSECGLSEKNSDGKLPIQLLLFDADCDRKSLEYTAAVHLLLLKNPAVHDIFE